MKLLGNILWFLVAGFWLGMSYVIAGLIMCITIIGIPFGIQAFKLAGFSFWPFGKAVVPHERAICGRGCLNVLWLIFAGIWLAIEHSWWASSSASRSSASRSASRASSSPSSRCGRSARPLSGSRTSPTGSSRPSRSNSWADGGRPAPDGSAGDRRALLAFVGAEPPERGGLHALGVTDEGAVIGGIEREDPTLVTFALWLPGRCVALIDDPDALELECSTLEVDVDVAAGPDDDRAGVGWLRHRRRGRRGGGRRPERAKARGALVERHLDVDRLAGVDVHLEPTTEVAGEIRNDRRWPGPDVHLRSNHDGPSGHTLVDHLLVVVIQTGGAGPADGVAPQRRRDHGPVGALEAQADLEALDEVAGGWFEAYPQMARRRVGVGPSPVGPSPAATTTSSDGRVHTNTPTATAATTPTTSAVAQRPNEDRVWDGGVSRLSLMWGSDDQLGRLVPTTRSEPGAHLNDREGSGSLRSPGPSTDQVGSTGPQYVAAKLSASGSARYCS